MKQLTPFEDAFLTEYINNGFIGSHAYETLRPGKAQSTNWTESSRLLNHEHIKIALQERLAERKEVAEVNKSTLIADARRIMKKAEKRHQYSSALKGVDIQANLTGAYSQDEGDASKYMAFMNKVHIDVNVNNQGVSSTEITTQTKSIEGKGQKGELSSNTAKYGTLTHDSEGIIEDQPQDVVNEHDTT